jgi:acyl-CoA thioester hydrolase
MKLFESPVQIRWSDLDPNFHLRHSVYYDWGAMCRVEFLSKYGLTSELMQQLHFGPIIFREECVFKREIRMGDPVTISLELIQSKKDYSRWTIRHNIMKNKDTVAAILTIDGAWIDTQKRKLALPPQEGIDVFAQMPVNENFQWLD